MLSKLELSQSLTSQFNELTINENVGRFQSPAVYGNYTNPNDEKPITAKGSYDLGDIEFEEDYSEKQEAQKDGDLMQKVTNAFNDFLLAKFTSKDS